MAKFVLDSVCTDGCDGGGGNVVPGGRVLNFGLCEARRLRGFVGEVGGGGASEILLRGGVMFEASGRPSGTVTLADVLDEFDFCRLCGGGDL